MFRSSYLSVLFVAVFLNGSPAAQTPLARSSALVNRSQPFVPGELLVGFHEGAGPAYIASVFRQHGLVQRENLDARPGARALRRVAFRVSARETLADQTERVIAALLRNPFVRFAEPNYVAHTAQLPNDPLLGYLYGLRNIEQTGGTFDADIDASDAWDVTTGAPNVIVFVIDTGVDYNHPDLAANMWTNAAEAAGIVGQDDDGNGYIDDIHGINAINGNPSPGNPMDDYGHGTHVAGTIGARGNNGIGVVGVAWNVRIGACKFINNSDSGTYADAIECLNYVNRLKAAGQNVKVTNNSWTGGFSQALEDAFAAVDQPGIEPILHACAAGNQNKNNDASPSYPASFDLPNIVSVAATDQNDLYAWFSNYGATSVDVAAPGVAILSTVPAFIDPGGYAFYSGTSMATPHVAGAAALIWAAHPDTSAADVKMGLLNGADWILGNGTNASKPTVTFSRLNVNTSIHMLYQMVHGTPPPSAVQTLSAADRGPQWVRLTWFANDGFFFSGAASPYEIRYSAGPINEGNWGSATPVVGERVYGLPYPQEAFIVTGLQPGTTYYFALKVHDSSGSQSALSNVASDTTLSALASSAGQFGFFFDNRQ